MFSRIVWYNKLAMNVLLLEQDRPMNYNCHVIGTRQMNYEEAMVDLVPKNGYEPYIIQNKIHVQLQSNDLVDLLDGLRAVKSKWNFMRK